MLAKLFIPAPKRSGRRDHRMRALLMVLLGTALLGYLVSMMPGRGVETSVKAPGKRIGLSDLPGVSADARRAQAEVVPPDPSAQAEEPRDPMAAQAEGILKDADKQVRAKKYDDAIKLLHGAHAQLKDNPHAYLLMGRALEGKKDYELARDFYAAAVDRNPILADAYYGFATTSESMGDLEAAIGGMRNFLHVQSPKADQNRLQIAEARSAIWEWEAKLGRGEWGPTKGIPPGFTEAELKRDGRGVGVKMPVPGSERPDGSKKYEIKHQDKFQMFNP